MSGEVPVTASAPWPIRRVPTSAAAKSGQRNHVIRVSSVSTTADPAVVEPTPMASASGPGSGAPTGQLTPRVDLASDLARAGRQLQSCTEDAGKRDRFVHASRPQSVALDSLDAVPGHA